MLRERRLRVWLSRDGGLLLRRISSSVNRSDLPATLLAWLSLPARPSLLLLLLLPLSLLDAAAADSVVGGLLRPSLAIAASCISTAMPPSPLLAGEASRAKEEAAGTSGLGRERAEEGTEEEEEEADG